MEQGPKGFSPSTKKQASAAGRTGFAQNFYGSKDDRRPLVSNSTLSQIPEPNRVSRE